jgi:serine/threonine protein phosphatase PrpC
MLTYPYINREALFINNHFFEMDIEIDSSIGENDRLLYSYAQVKGTRSSDPIEDTFAIKPDINHMASFFGVYDGHGGKCQFSELFLELVNDLTFITGTYISAFARDHLHEYVFQNPVFHQRCLTDAFYKIDEQLETGHYLFD